YQRNFGLRAVNFGRGESRPIMIGAVPLDGVPREQAMREVEEVMRVRHNLKLDQPNDFDLVTQDAVLKVWDRISQGTFLALVVIHSMRLRVGGTGWMSILPTSARERPRETGVRKAPGPRRVEVLWQFLLEAVFLTSAGGLFGIAVGSAIGLAVHFFSSF